jgi:hypothetical protein
VSGSGPITVTSAVTDIENSPLATGNNTKWVNITVQASSANASAMWLRTFRDIADRGGLPATAYTNGSAGNFAFINITANPQIYGVQLTLTQVNVSADYVEEYTSGGISRSWRNVPAYAAPGYSTATTTAISASPGSSIFGNPVTFTAVVTPSSGSGTPTGTVTFYNGGVSLGTVTLGGGSASITTSSLSVGVHSMNATYSGDTTYQASASAILPYTVSAAPSGFIPWYDCAWTYRKNITIDKTKVVGGSVDPITSFAVLISLASDGDLQAHALGNGDDILFTDSSGMTKIPHEIESYSSGTLVAWVNVPSLSSAANTSIFMYYGNPSASSQQNPQGVWDTGYKAVWHLRELGVGGAGEFRDSTSNGNNGQGGGAGANPPTRVAAKIGNGQSFTTTNNQFIQVPDSSSLQITGPITVEAWINGNNWTDSGGGNKSILGRRYGGGTQDSYKIGVWPNNGASSSPYGWLTTGSVTGSTVNTGSWYHVAMNLTAPGGTAYLHLNGARVATQAGSSISVSSHRVIIGGEENGAGTAVDQLFGGMIDEVRISNVARKDNWIATEYNNQNSPGTFFYRNASESHSC